MYNISMKTRSYILALSGSFIRLSYQDACFKPCKNYDSPNTVHFLPPEPDLKLGIIINQSIKNSINYLLVSKITCDIKVA